MFHPLLAISLSLTHPWFLAASGLLLLPWLFHLFGRGSRRRIELPTARLLAESQALLPRMHRLRRRLLLTARCASVIVLAAAAAGPWLHAQPHNAATDDEKRTLHLLLIDLSASTRRLQDGQQAADRIRHAAITELSSLEPHRDVVQLLLINGPARPFPPRPSDGFPMVRKAIEEFRPGDGTADLPAALSVARQMLKGYPGPGRIWIGSDMQASNIGEAFDHAFLRDNEAEVFTAVDSPAQNLRLQALRLLPARVKPGGPAMLEATLLHTGSQPHRTDLRIEVGGVDIAARQVELPAGQPFTVRMPFAAPQKPGEQPLRLHLGSDAMPADDTAFAVLEVRSESPVLLICDTPDDPQSSRYFLQRLAGIEGYGGSAARALTAGTQSLPEADLLIVADAEAASPTLAADLVAAVERGSGCLLLAGGRGIDRLAEAIDQLTDGKALPFMPSPPSGTQHHRLDTAHAAAVLGDSFDLRSTQALARIAFSAVGGVDQLRSGSVTFLRSEDGTPIAAHRRHGNGRFAWFNASLDPAQGRLLADGLFAATLLHWFETLSAEAPSLVSVVHAPLEWLVQTPGDVMVTGPDAQPRPVFIESLGGDRRRASLFSADSAGHYALSAGGKAAGLRAVNIDPREGDPTIVAAVKPERYPPVHQSNLTTLPAPATPRQPFALMPWLLLGLLVMMVAESCLARRPEP